MRFETRGRMLSVKNKWMFVVAVVRGKWHGLKRPYCWRKLRRFSSSVKSILKPFGYARLDGLRVYECVCVRFHICPSVCAHAPTPPFLCVCVCECVCVCVCDHTCMSVCHTCWYVSRLVVYAKALWLVRHIEAWRPLLSAAYWAVICQTFVSPLSPSAVKGAQSLSETRWHPPTTSTHYNNFSCQCNKAGYGMKWDAVLGVWKYDKVE